jgi:RNA polymerase sigma-70 factor (ECF subfamily)
MDEPCRDETLMAEVARGQRSALEPLIRRHVTPLLTFIQRMTGDYHRGEELFQEVFLAVWCKRHLYEYPRSFKTWLYAIAINQCRQAFRRKQSQTFPLADFGSLVLAPAGQSPVDTMISTENATLVAGALALLPPQQRSVVVLRVWQQLSYAEIGQALETSEGTVRSYMHHGLAALRKHLESRLGDGG